MRSLLTKLVDSDDVVELRSDEVQRVLALRRAAHAVILDRLRGEEITHQNWSDLVAAHDSFVN